MRLISRSNQITGAWYSSFSKQRVYGESPPFTASLPRTPWQNQWAHFRFHATSRVRLLSPTRRTVTAAQVRSHSNTHQGAHCEMYASEVIVVTTDAV